MTIHVFSFDAGAASPITRFGCTGASSVPQAREQGEAHAFACTSSLTD